MYYNTSKCVVEHVELRELHTYLKTPYNRTPVSTECWLSNLNHPGFVFSSHTCWTDVYNFHDVSCLYTDLFSVGEMMQQIYAERKEQIRN